MSGCVTVTGPPFSIWRLNSGITLLKLPDNGPARFSCTDDHHVFAPLLTLALFSAVPLKKYKTIGETYAYSQKKLQHDTDQIIGSRHPFPEDRDTHNMQNACDHSCYRDLDQLMEACETPYTVIQMHASEHCQEVYIFALQIRKEHLKRKRTVGNNVKVIPIMKASNKTYLLYSFRTLTDINLYKEFARLVKSRRLSVRNFVNMFVYFSRSHYEADLIDKKMKGHVNKESIFYSYRFEYQPYVAMLLKKKWELNSKIVSRAHRYDLYEEEHKGNYIPILLIDDGSEESFRSEIRDISNC